MPCGFRLEGKNTARLTAFPATLRAKSCGDAMCDLERLQNHRSSEDQEIAGLVLADPAGVPDLQTSSLGNICRRMPRRRTAENVGEA